MRPLLLRPPEPGDEDDFRAAHRLLEQTDGFPFGLGYDPDEPWDDYLRRLADHRRGVNLPPDWVPSTFLVADVGGRLVGRVSIRHRLNDHLFRFGGHIGYAVLPAYRRRGYATEMLRQSLELARAVGVEQALLVCDDGNVGSARVIEACGGRLEAVVQPAPGEPPRRRYWIG